MNTRTQAVIETACVCSGEEWVALEEPKESPTPEVQKAPTKRKKKDVSANE